MAATRTGPPPAPACSPRTSDALRSLTSMADADGLVALDLRALAAELDLTTLATRVLLAALVERGALSEVGRRVYALAGSAAMARAGTPPAQPEPRTPPHDAVHEGTGSPLLW